MSCIRILAGIISGNQTINPPVPPPPSDTYYHALRERVVWDENGLYAGFEMRDQYTDGSEVGVHKEAGSHGAAGPFIFKRSTDGLTDTSHQITVTGHGTIESAAHSFYVQKTGAHAGRIIIAWQDFDADWLKFAYRDGVVGAFTYAGQVNAPSGFQMFPTPEKMMVMPSGEIRCGVYCTPTSGDSQLREIISTNTGVSWTLQAAFATGALYSEFTRCITHNTGVDATCKIIYGIRLWVPGDGASYYVFRKSSNGGATVTYENVDDAGSFVDDHGDTISGPFNRGILYSFLQSNGPLKFIKFNGEIIAACGERGSGSGWISRRLKFIKATPDDAFENKFSNWTRPIQVRGYNAEYNGSSVDCGYVDLWEHQEEEDGDPILAYADYDTSAYTHNPAITTKRCHIYQGSLTDWLYFPVGVPRTDIITGASFFSGYTSDFNADHSYNGDTQYIQLAAGTYTNLQWRGKASGVKLVGPETGVATITEYIAFGDWTEDVVIMSHPNNPLREQSFVFNDAPRFYFTQYVRGTGNILIKGVSCISGRIAQQIETRLSEYANLAAFPAIGALDHNYRALDTEIEYHWEAAPTNAYVANPFPIAQAVQNVKILNCVIDGTDMEGTYNGADLGSPIPTNTTVRNTHYLTTGRDACQARNGYIAYIDVTIDNAGDNGESTHGHGSPIGANSTGALLQRVKVTSAFANSLFSNTLGEVTCELCYFQGAGENGMYASNYTSTTENIFGMESITYNLVNCHFEGVNKALWIQMDPAKLPMTVNRYSTNTYSGAVTIETGNGIDDNLLT